MDNDTHTQDETPAEDGPGTHTRSNKCPHRRDTTQDGVPIG